MDGQVACMGETSSADGIAVSTAERARPGTDRRASKILRVCV
jgi:hypothetical protein